MGTEVKIISDAEYLARTEKAAVESLTKACGYEIPKDFFDKSPAAQLSYLKDKLGNHTCETYLAKFTTVDAKMQEVKDMVLDLSGVDDPVIITGPTGTGKELLAHALHGNREGPFVAINCAGLPETLTESQLFGHKAGAFTDARNESIGLLRQAEHGTVFLDEIGDMSLTNQSKILRAIQFNEVYPVGGVDKYPISCRFIAATNHDLKESMRNKTFRKDLYARLFTFELRTTGLSERLEDIPFILMQLYENHAKREVSAEEKIRLMTEVFALDALPRRLLEEDIPMFNVRALETFVRRWDLRREY